MKQQVVSDAVIRRLPRYHRQLEQLVLRGVERVSSGELAEQLRLNPSQIRQDFNYFGGFGQQGYGYNVATLYGEIGAILGLKREHKLVIAGAGNLAKALARYEGFSEKGFSVAALFDNDEGLIGKDIAGLCVRDVSELAQFIKNEAVDIGVIAARRRSAQYLADIMVESGIKGIWNFVPTDLSVSVPIQNVHLIDSLLMLSFSMEG